MFSAEGLASCHAHVGTWGSLWGGLHLSAEGLVPYCLRHGPDLPVWLLSAVVCYTSLDNKGPCEATRDRACLCRVLASGVKRQEGKLASAELRGASSEVPLGCSLDAVTTNNWAQIPSYTRGNICKA